MRVAKRTRVAIAASTVLLTVLADVGGTAVARRRHRRAVLHDCGDPSQGSPPAGFDVRLSLDRTTYIKGRPVQLTLRVTNNSGESFTHTVGHPDAAFEIVTRGKVIWSSTWGQAYPAIAFEETFAPGEEKSTTATWNQDLCRTDGGGGAADPAIVPGPPPAGDYTAYGSWRGRWSAEPVTFKIRR